MTATRRSTGGVIERTTRTGTTFAIRYRAAGRRWYETLAVTTRADAEQALTDQLDRIRLGVWTPPDAPVVEDARTDPTLREFATDWFDRRRREVEPRTADCWKWALSHVLGFLGELPVSRVTVERVDAYKTAKLDERERLEAALAVWRCADSKTRGPRPPKSLSNGSINRSLRTLAMVLDDAVEYGFAESNAARGKRRRLKADRPQRIWLKVDEVRSLLAAAGSHRAFLATMALAGLRVGEVCELRWRSVDLARARLTVERSKTDAGVRDVRIVDVLLDELKAWRTEHLDAGPDDLVFPTASGRPRDRHNVRARILLPALARANKALVEAGLPVIAHVTNHTLRRTFASLLYADGATPAEVMEQMGHESAALALEVYARVIAERQDAGDRMSALVRDGYRALTGTRAAQEEEASPDLATEMARKPLG